MFYARTKDGYTEITARNVYTACPQCGTMHQVDLADLLAGQYKGLEGIRVYCHRCSVERAKLRPNEPGSAQLLAEHRGEHR